jgi:hypothetical protein
MIENPSVANFSCHTLLVKGQVETWTIRLNELRLASISVKAPGLGWVGSEEQQAVTVQTNRKKASR